MRSPIRFEGVYRDIELSVPYRGIGDYRLGLEYKYTIRMKYGKRKVSLTFYSDKENFFHTNERGPGFYRIFLEKIVDKFISEAFLGYKGRFDCISTYNKALRLFGNYKIVESLYDKIENPTNPFDKHKKAIEKMDKNIPTEILNILKNEN